MVKTAKSIIVTRHAYNVLRHGWGREHRLKNYLRRGVGALALIIVCICFATVARGQTPAPSASTNLPVAERVVLPKSVPDPIEPVNRVIWGFNKVFMSALIDPTARIYRAIVAKPIRNGINKMHKNITYPDRLINNLLQGKFGGARDETYRFLCNTTIGLVGFYDPAAAKFKIQPSEADFGQTFGQWGWEPSCFLMLPVFGPSNERDALGLAADTAANPLLYFSPYSLELENPLTYISPYSYFSYGATYNDLSDSVVDYVRFSRAEMDPYSEIQYAWTFTRQNRVADFQVKGKQDKASLETIESVFFTYKDRDFPDHGLTRSVVIPSTGKSLDFTFWLQRKKAPVVYIVPGLGSHRLAQTSVALAELMYKNGFSAVCISSPFDSEFMENASTANLPAYLPVDGNDLHVALTLIDQHLNQLYPNHLAAKALMGYSMGALETLYIASTESTNQSGLLKFDRYMSISSPVSLRRGIGELDAFYNAPLKWPSAQRTDNLDNTFLKVAALSKGTLTPQTTLPFDAVESQFLIGLTFRLALRDIIYSSQSRHNQGILHEPIRHLRRKAIYDDILQYSYKDYFEKFVTPYYQAKNIGPSTADALEKAGNLRNYEAGLRANPNIRLIANQNDFLLTKDDIAWLRSTFPAEQMTIFAEGGHLGNLSNTNVQSTILGDLQDLHPLPQKKK
jgi:ABC-type transporter lipoprotein component MlaA